jgi:hypothetical protein
VTYVNYLDPNDAFAEIGHIRSAGADIDGMLDKIARLVKRTIADACKVSFTLWVSTATRPPTGSANTATSTWDCRITGERIDHPRRAASSGSSPARPRPRTSASAPRPSPGCPPPARWPGWRRWSPRPNDEDEDEERDDGEDSEVPAEGAAGLLAEIKANPGRPGLDTFLDEVAKLGRVRSLGYRPTCSPIRQSGG